MGIEHLGVNIQEKESNYINKEIYLSAKPEGMMVLDYYKQVYIGISNNIKKRIMSHWNGKKSLERLIFENIFESGLFYRFIWRA